MLTTINYAPSVETFKDKLKDTPLYQGLNATVQFSTSAFILQTYSVSCTDLYRNMPLIISYIPTNITATVFTLMFLNLFIA